MTTCRETVEFNTRKQKTDVNRDNVMILKKGPFKKFGEIAVEKGYATPDDVNNALEIQNGLRIQGKNELIGMIMLANDIITNEQLIDILRYYETS